MILEGAVAMVTEGTTIEFISIVIGAEVAVEGEAQVALEVITTVTTSLLFREDEVKVAPVPELIPFTCHW